MERTYVALTNNRRAAQTCWWPSVAQSKSGRNIKRTRSEFVEIAFRNVDITVEWRGTGVDEIGINNETGKTIIKINPKFFRHAEVEVLLGNPAKTDSVLGWTRELTFGELVQRMVMNDLKLVAKELEQSKEVY